MNVDLKKFRNAIISEGVDENKYDKLISSKIFRQAIKRYETGFINTKEFVDFCLKRLGNSISKKVFIEHFNGMLVEKPEMKKYIERISNNGDFRLLLLSNTNPLHWNYSCQKFPYILLLKNFAISYRLRLYKPDPRIYKLVLKRYNFEPSQTLYIDDRMDNCIAARSFGIKTIHFTDFKSFKTYVKTIIPQMLKR